MNKFKENLKAPKYTIDSIEELYKNAHKQLEEAKRKEKEEKQVKEI